MALVAPPWEYSGRLFVGKTRHSLGFVAIATIRAFFDGQWPHKKGSGYSAPFFTYVSNSYAERILATSRVSFRPSTPDRVSGSNCQWRLADLLEVTVQQTLQALAMTGLVASHLVNGVVDSVQTVLLSDGSQVNLALGCAELAVRESVRSGHFFTLNGNFPIICATGKIPENDATLWHWKKPFCGSRCHKNATL